MPVSVPSEAVVPAARGGVPQPASPPVAEGETPLESLASLCTILAVALFVMTFIFQNFEIPSASMENTLLIGDHVVVDRSTLAPGTSWAPFVAHRAVRRGDVIVFMKPHSEEPDLILVKRAIAVAGDRIHLRNGVVYLNGVAQKEPYAIQPDPDSLISYRDDFPADVAGLDSEARMDLDARGDCSTRACTSQEAIDRRTMAWAADLSQYIQGDDLVVPPGMIFAMGDNRAYSLDSRFWGFVPAANILGRPEFVYWSFRTPADQENKTSAGDRIAFVAHVFSHLISGTRWQRTLHIIR